MDRGSTLKESLGRFLRVLGDLLLVNALWFVCSLPVITAGPATCAAFSVLMKVVREESNGTIGEFFGTFKKSFKNGLFLGLIADALIIIIAVNVMFAMRQSRPLSVIYFILSGILGVLLLIFISYVFALEARFENTVKGHIVNAFKLAVISPGKTLTMWLVYAILPASMLLLPEVAVYYLGWFYLLFGVSLPLYINSKTLRNLFDRIPGETNNES